MLSANLTRRTLTGEVILQDGEYAIADFSKDAARHGALDPSRYSHLPIYLNDCTDEFERELK